MDLSWLDGGCNAAFPKCDLASARLVVSNVRTSAIPPPPHPPPSPLPPSPPLSPPPSAPPELFDSTTVANGLFVLCVLGAIVYVYQQRRPKIPTHPVKPVDARDDDDEDDDDDDAREKQAVPRRSRHARARS